MLVNFKNVNMGDIDEFVNGDEERKSGHIACQVRSIFIRPTKFGKQDGFLVFMDSNSGPDPRLHFLDKEKAEAAYQTLVTHLADDVTYFEMDALVAGAL